MESKVVFLDTDMHRMEAKIDQLLEEIKELKQSFFTPFPQSVRDHKFYQDIQILQLTLDAMKSSIRVENIIEYAKKLKSSFTNK